MATTPIPSGKRAESTNGLNGGSKRLLDLMLKRATPDGLVMLSFNDIYDEISCSSPSGVSPIMRRLEERGYVKIFNRPGGRSKTTYCVRPDPNEPWKQISQAVEPAPKTKERAPLGDRRYAANQPSTPEPRCDNCRFNLEGDTCRRYPPTRLGFPATRSNNWCGEWQAKIKPQ